jgi:hypothetical protein
MIILISLLCLNASAQLSHTLTVAINQPVECDPLLALDDTQAIVHPNPASEWIEVKPLFIGDAISIYTLAGQLVYSEIASFSSRRINVQALPKGIYLVTIKRHRTSTSIKINLTGS